MSLKHLFTSYELATLAKQHGFNEPCFAFYDEVADFYYSDPSSSNFTFVNYHSGGTVLAPLYQQLTDWLREKHNINVSIYMGHDEKRIWYNMDLEPIRLGFDYEPLVCDTSAKPTYYEVLEQALHEAFKKIAQ